MLSSLVTTVVTPAKCSGPRCSGAPSSTPVSAADDARSCRSRAGRPRSAAGANSRSTPSASASCGVALLVARVGVQVLARAELGRVDEQRHHHHVALLAGAAEQGEVTVVEGAHGRHQPDRCARRAARARAPRAARRRCGSSSYPRSAASARVCSTSSSKRASSSGAASATARRWAATVASSPRAIGPVSASLGPELGEVVDRAAQQRHEQLPGLVRLEARAGGDPLGRRLEGDQEVGGHRGRGVVGGAALVVDLERRHPEHARETGGEGERLGRGPRDRTAGARERPQAARRRP